MGLIQPDPIGVLGGSLLFSAVDDLHEAKFDFGLWYVDVSGHGRELWKVGPAGKADLGPGHHSHGSGHQYRPQRLHGLRLGASVTMNGAVYFVVTSKQYKAELWRSDGSGASRVAADLPLPRQRPDAVGLHPGGRRRQDLLPGLGGGYQGCGRPTAPGREVASAPWGRRSAGCSRNRIVFTLSGAEGVNRGSPIPVGARCSDLQPGAIGSYPLALTGGRATCSLQRRHGATGRDVWRTDGTAARTLRVHDAPLYGAYRPVRWCSLPAAFRMFYLNALTDQRNTDLQLWELSPDNPWRRSRRYASRSHLRLPRTAVGHGRRCGSGEGTPTGVVTPGRALGCWEAHR